MTPSPRYSHINQPHPSGITATFIPITAVFPGYRSIPTIPITVQLPNADVN